MPTVTRGVLRYNVTNRTLQLLTSIGMVLVALGCDHGTPRPPTEPAEVAAPHSGTIARAHRASDVESSSTPTANPASATSELALARRSKREFARDFHQLSESGEYFFSDNTISNETSYLQVAGDLTREVAPGGAYLGVGPEQNFTYIALTRPSIAYIVDIRRDNALLHLLYKAVFHRAKTRAEFVTLLLGRPYDPTGDPGVAGDVSAVLLHAQRNPPDEALFRTTHRQLVKDISGWGIALSAQDERRLEAMHRSFFDQQLDLRFALHEANGRTYPTLEQLLSSRDPSGSQLGFLATRAGFETVQRLQRLHRVVPVVGDFAGTHAIQGVAKELKQRGLFVSAFYVSNVEQYLFEPAKWTQYVANVQALPVRDDAVFIRCYLDQGRRHPRQLPGHRTSTMLQPVSRFFDQQGRGGYQTFWQLVTDI